MAVKKLPKVISIRKFAKDIIGCAEGTVRAAIREGKISEAVVKDKNGRNKGIDWAKGQVEWAKNYSRGKNLQSTVEDSLSDVGTAAGEEIAEIADSRKRTEYYKAELARIELEEKQKILVPVDDVRKQLFSMATEIRIKFQNIPDICIDEIMSMDDRNEAYRKLQETIDDQLRELTEIINRDVT